MNEFEVRLTRAEGMVRAGNALMLEGRAEQKLARAERAEAVRRMIDDEGQQLSDVSRLLGAASRQVVRQWLQAGRRARAQEERS